MGKILVFFVALSMLGLARCYGAEVDASSLPFLGASAPAAPAYVSAIGTPAAVAVPEVEPAKWFAAAEKTDANTPEDVYDATKWKQVDSFFAIARTQAGWTEACKKAGTSGERSKEPLAGALGCSENPSVTALQRVAVQVLGVRAAVALWVRGVPGFPVGSISGRQGELRVMCSFDAILREGGEKSALAEACTKGLDTAYTKGDGAATFTALGDAYKAIAAEIAKRDPSIDAEPGYFTSSPAPTKTP